MRVHDVLAFQQVLQALLSQVAVRTLRDVGAPRQLGTRPIYQQMRDKMTGARERALKKTPE